jgi:hypothetical protein
MTLTAQVQPNGILGFAATNVYPVTGKFPAFPRLGEMRVAFQWYYTRKGVEKESRKLMRLHMTDAGLMYLVEQIVQYIEEHSWDNERCNARLVIYYDNEYDAIRTVRNDIPCPVRVMQQVKKKFPYVNG